MSAYAFRYKIIKIGYFYVKNRRCLRYCIDNLMYYRYNKEKIRVVAAKARGINGSVKKSSWNRLRHMFYCFFSERMFIERRRKVYIGVFEKRIYFGRVRG